MSSPKLSKLELSVMEAFWKLGASSVREVQESFPARKRPAYTTVQTVVYRLEAKQALRRTRKIGNAHLFEPTVSRSAAHERLLDEVLELFGGRAQPLISHLVQTGRLTQEDIEEARKALRELDTKPPAAKE